MNSVATDNWTPLHLAAVSGAMNCLSPLSAAGAEMNARDTGGCSPLHLSVTSRNPEITKKLLELGCDKRVRNNAGETALDRAKLKGREAFYPILS